VIVKENQVDAITAVSGSGPAYVFLLVECMVKSAKKLGCNQAQSEALVLQTLKGSLELLDRSQESAESLRRRVTSQGGTTEAAIKVFGSKGIEKIYLQALTAAKKRAKELSK